MRERSARILVVDGGSRLGESIARPLEDNGYEVLLRASAVGLPAALAESEPDLLLLDAAVPEISSFEICGELRATDAGRLTPIVLLSAADPGQEAIARGLLCGADDFCVVSGRMIELLARVRVQLRNKRDRERLHRVRDERDHARREAVADPLTGIANRRSMEASIAAAIGAGAPFAVLFLDIDHFKGVNDTFGHEAGDVVLKAVADCLARSVRGGDRCGRFGGEEFVMLLGDITPEMSLVVAERHRQAIEALRPTVLGGRTVTVSIGVAAFEPGRGETGDALVRRADGALYEAKRRGRNRVVAASPEPIPLRLVPPPPTGIVVPVNPVIFDPAPQGPSPLERALLEKLGSGVAGLPMLAESSAEALQLAGDAHTDIAKIARLVDRDPPLAARFVAVASSALYVGRATAKATTTQQALVRIGLATARDLLFQVVYERSGRDLPRYKLEVASSFRRSVRTALAARLLAAELGLDAPYAYLSGLLHDIGEARIYRVLSQLPAAVAPEGNPQVAELVARHHAKAGAAIAEAWRLPTVIADACALHHLDAAKVRPHVRLVMAADVLVDLCERGTPGADDAVAALVGFGVRPERVRALVDGLSGGGELDAPAASRDTRDLTPAPRVSTAPVGVAAGMTRRR